MSEKTDFEPRDASGAFAVGTVCDLLSVFFNEGPVHCEMMDCRECKIASNSELMEKYRAELRRRREKGG